jgi:3-deoxy-manno-octulosonate cytidylyltransferase (CMP-KDO synthetase)
MSYRIIIPARIGSTRLPNKPLKDIAGKTLIERVVYQAKKTTAKSIHVATDSEEIMDHCNEINVEALLTSSDHKTGSDRIFESCDILKLLDQELIINIQGDEPFIDPKDIENLAQLAEKENANTVTLYTNLESNELENNDVVKLWLDSNIVKDFSRYGDHLPRKDAKKHIGVYGYRVNFLQKFIKWRQSENEIKRNLEQMRVMDNGGKIYAIESSGKYHIGVDTESDLKLATEIALDLE